MSPPVSDAWPEAAEEQSDERREGPLMGMPAARVGDMHVCPMVTGVVPHVGGPILPPGCPTVLIGGMPAARVGDMATCVGPPDVIAMGSFTVLIGGMPAARLGDLIAPRRDDRPRLPDRADRVSEPRPFRRDFALAQHLRAGRLRAQRISTNVWRNLPRRERYHQG